MPKLIELSVSSLFDVPIEFMWEALSFPHLTGRMNGVTNVRTVTEPFKDDSPVGLQYEADMDADGVTIHVHGMTVGGDFYGSPGSRRAWTEDYIDLIDYPGDVFVYAQFTESGAGTHVEVRQTQRVSTVFYWLSYLSSRGFRSAMKDRDVLHAEAQKEMVELKRVIEEAYLESIDDEDPE